jgi:hypothetical protein
MALGNSAKNGVPTVSGLVCEDRAEYAQGSCVLVTRYDVHIKWVQFFQLR